MSKEAATSTEVGFTIVTNFPTAVIQLTMETVKTEGAGT